MSGEQIHLQVPPESFGVNSLDQFVNRLKYTVLGRQTLTQLFVLKIMCPLNFEILGTVKSFSSPTQSLNQVSTD